MLHDRTAATLALALVSIARASPLTTNASSPPYNAALLNDTAAPQCIDDLEFLTGNFNPDDCWKAVKRLIDEYAWPEGQTQYEFLPPDMWVEGDTSLPKKRTAQKWDYGTCVATILNLSAFEPGEWPFASYMTPITDVGTYGQSAHWAEFTARACITTGRPSHVGEDAGGVSNSTVTDITSIPSLIDPVHQSPASGTPISTLKKKRWRERVGYTITGKNQGIGVFIWAKGSNMDIRFDNHIPD